MSIKNPSLAGLGHFEQSIAPEQESARNRTQQVIRVPIQLIRDIHLAIVTRHPRDWCTRTVWR